MHGVNYWMEDHGLQLAMAKTEIVLFTRKHIETIIPIRIGEDRIVTKDNLKHLDAVGHEARSTEKATRLTTALSRLMRKRT